MTYQITNWIGSDWKAEKEPMMQPGEYDLYIRNASYDPEIGLYRMTVEDVQTE